VARIVVYRQYNDYIYWDGTLENVMKLKRAFDELGFKWYVIAY
jgi:hypothetical protein